MGTSLHLSGFATYRDLAAWTIDSFRFVEHREFIALSSAL